MTYGDIRKPALALWLAGTSRVRVNADDDFNASYECTWQNCYQAPNPNSTDHYSVFCSIGDWNTNLTDLLEDDRFDGLSLVDQEDAKVIFRQYTKIFLIVSEIITDFQDTLNVFTTLQKKKKYTFAENQQSRGMLDQHNQNIHIQDLFDFINSCCKHKINNIHFCNHHLDIHFVDLGSPSPSANTVRIGDIQAYVSQDFIQPAQKEADVVEMPSLPAVISVVLNCYKVVDDAFRNNRAQFAAFANMFKGQVKAAKVAAPQVAIPVNPVIQTLVETIIKP